MLDLEIHIVSPGVRWYWTLMVLDTRHINPARTKKRRYITACECRTLSKLTLNYKQKEIVERTENDRREGQRRAASAALDGFRKRGLTGGPGRIDRPGSRLSEEELIWQEPSQTTCQTVRQWGGKIHMCKLVQLCVSLSLTSGYSLCFTDLFI